MRRRKLFAFAAGASRTALLGARAQRVPMIGYLGLTTAEQSWKLIEITTEVSRHSTGD